MTTGFRKPADKYLNIAIDVIDQIALMSKNFRNSLPDDDHGLEQFTWHWGRAIEKTRNYPDFVYFDAVDLMFSESGETRYEILPYHYLDACKTALIRANDDPQKRRIVADHNLKLREYRDKMLDGE